MRPHIIWIKRYLLLSPPSRFAFLSNYGRLFADRSFWQSLRFTLLFVATTIPLEMGLGMVFAVILNERLRYRNALRATVLIPWAVPTIVAARTWELIYNYGYGLANYLMGLLHISSGPVNWLGSPVSAFFALVLADYAVKHSKHPAPRQVGQ